MQNDAKAVQSACAVLAAHAERIAASDPAAAEMLVTAARRYQGGHDGVRPSATTVASSIDGDAIIKRQREEAMAYRVPAERSA